MTSITRVIRCGTEHTSFSAHPREMSDDSTILVNFSGVRRRRLETDQRTEEAPSSVARSIVSVIERSARASAESRDIVLGGE